MKATFSDSVRFALGDIVYFKCQPESSGMVTGIIFTPTGLSYYVTWDDKRELRHYECELTTEKVTV